MLTFCVEWTTAPSVPSVSRSGVVRIRQKLTLDMIVDLCEGVLCSKSDFVRQDIVGRRSPHDRKVVVSGHPFCTDIRVYLHCMRFAVVRCCRDGVVGQGKGLIYEIGRLFRCHIRRRASGQRENVLAYLDRTKECNGQIDGTSRHYKHALSRRELLAVVI